MRAIRRFTVRPVLPEALASLGTLAANLRWSWHPETQDVFESADPALWESVGQDPVKLLGNLGQARLRELAGDPTYLARLGQAQADLDAYLSQDRWYQRKGGVDAPRSIAYFSPEYGITAVLPQYSGGLGILAGDHLKSASDLGIPIIGVGLLYKHGYFKQSLSVDGWQQETYPVLDPDELPLTPLREEDGSRAKVTVQLPGGPDLVATLWVAHVGRVPLLLMDTDLEENPGHYREVTDRLYGGTSEHRLRQEILLGVGGVRALRVFTRLTGAPEPGGLPHQRGPRGLPRPGADPRAHGGQGRSRARLRHRARGLPRRHRLHHPHPGPGRHRPLRARPGGAVLRLAPASCRACRSTGSWRSVPRTTPAATPTCSTWR